MKVSIRSGFTILEVTVSILILGMMLPTLFYVINQSIRFKNTIEKEAPRAAAEMYAYEILFRDILQLTVPVTMYEAWEKYSQPKAAQPSPGVEKVEKVAPAAPKQEEPEPAPIFVLEKDERDTLYITFYSNNSLFDGLASLAVRPLYIVYTITAKTEDTDQVYTLTRYELERRSVYNPAEAIKDTKGLVLYKDKKSIKAKVVLQSFVLNDEGQKQEPSELLEDWDPVELWQESRQVIPNYLLISIVDEFEQEKEYLFPIPASSYYGTKSYEYIASKSNKESSPPAPAEKDTQDATKEKGGQKQPAQQGNPLSALMKSGQSPAVPQPKKPSGGKA